MSILHRTKLTKEYVDKLENLQTRYPDIDFSDTEYVDSRAAMDVVCKHHGDIQVRASDLLRARTKTETNNT